RAVRIVERILGSSVDHPDIDLLEHIGQDCLDRSPVVRRVVSVQTALRCDGGSSGNEIPVLEVAKGAQALLMVDPTPQPLPEMQYIVAHLPVDVLLNQVEARDVDEHRAVLAALPSKLSNGARE